MKKLFEIPIYALSRDELYKRYKQYFEDVRAKNPHLDENEIQNYMEIDTFPQRCWSYNHIIGFIQIVNNNSDIIFQLLLPYEKKKYYWRSHSKTFLYDVGLLGMHFYVSEDMTNYDIQKKAAEMLYNIIKDDIPKHFYVDVESFNNLNYSMDYLKIIEK